MTDPEKRFNQLESEFEHDFETLSQRLKDIYAQLDALAHADNSPHHDREELYMSVVMDGEFRTIFCSIDDYDWIKVRIQDSQGDQGHQYRSSLKTERKQTGGKHRVGGDSLHEEASRRGGLSQTDSMIVMAGLLEASYQDLITHEDSVILAYEK